MVLRDIPKLFGLPAPSELTELKAGHINRTFIAVCGGEKYIMQTLNGDIFRDPRAVMDNIAAADAAVGKLCSCTAALPRFLTCGDKNYAEALGGVWRIYSYIPAAGASAASPLSVGLAFGSFLRAAENMESPLKPPVEGYHDFGRYLAAMKRSGCNAPVAETALFRLEERLSKVFNASLKKRVIHGDAKADNVVVGEVPTVLDLDTIMYGYAATDYGDMIRSVCLGSKADPATIRSVTRGFSEGLGGCLSGDEIHSLYYGILMATGELAARYFTDSVAETRYFCSKTPAECHHRAIQLMAQLEMFSALETQIKDIIFTELA